MMLRVFLGVCLLAAASVIADQDDDCEYTRFGCCSHEDRREIQYLWQSVWSASFTERKVTIAKAVFDESVTRLCSVHHHYHRSSYSTLCLRGLLPAPFLLELIGFCF